MSICLSLSPSLCLSSSVSFSLSPSLSIYLSLCLSPYLSLYFSLSLSLSIYIYIYIYYISIYHSALFIFPYLSLSCSISPPPSLALSTYLIIVAWLRRTKIRVQIVHVCCTCRLASDWLVLYGIGMVSLSDHRVESGMVVPELLEPGVSSSFATCLGNILD